jgi:hypothetical protein
VLEGDCSTESTSALLLVVCGAIKRLGYLFGIFEICLLVNDRKCFSFSSVRNPIARVKGKKKSKRLRIFYF